MKKTEPIRRSFANAMASPEAPSRFAPLRSVAWTLLLLVTPWIAGCDPVNTALIQDRAVMWFFISLLAGVCLVGGASIRWQYLKRRGAGSGRS